MMDNGIFTDIYHPHNERLFKEARIDVLIFRYCKDKSLMKKCLYNDKSLYIENNNGLITFHDKIISKRIKLGDIFDIYVGMVSGRDSVYKNNEIGNIEVLTNEKKKEKYICINKFPSKNEKINEYLLKYKDELLKRKVKKFNDNNWFEWGRLINIKGVQTSNECIYVKKLTRDKTIAFKDKIMFFGSQLIMLVPKIKVNLNTIIEYLNSDNYKSNFVFSGRFKIGQRQLENSIIPL